MRNGGAIVFIFSFESALRPSMEVFAAKADPKRADHRKESTVARKNLTMPRAGLVLLFLRTPLGFAILAGLTTLFVALTLIPRSDEEQRGRLS